MDLASLLGLVIAFVLVIFGIVYSKTGIDFSVVINFLDVPSALITFGGAFCATLAMNSFKTFTGGLKSISIIFKSSSLDTAEIIKKIIDLSNVARKEGLLSLEEAAGMTSLISVFSVRAKLRLPLLAQVSSFPMTGTLLRTITL